jgi:hypothetical protein
LAIAQRFSEGIMQSVLGEIEVAEQTDQRGRIRRDSER